MFFPGVKNLLTLLQRAKKKKCHRTEQTRRASFDGPYNRQYHRPIGNKPPSERGLRSLLIKMLPAPEYTRSDSIPWWIGSLWIWKTIYFTSIGITDPPCKPVCVCVCLLLVRILFYALLLRSHFSGDRRHRRFSKRR